VRTISTRSGDTGQVIREIFDSENDYTAIFCYCDVIAFEAIFVLNQMGIKVPQDVAVAGVDDIHSDLVLPVQLTSASFNREELAKNCINTLINNIKSGVPRSERSIFTEKIIDVRLTVGQTT
jgi:LacI family transcriptional regulator